MARRVEKKVSTYNGNSWSVTSVTRFVYDGWRLLEELDVPSGGTGTPTPIRKYAWGLDLAGLSGGGPSLERAGGIGGLLSVYDTNGTTTTADDKTYLYQYDGNGNVVQLVDVSNGTVVAKYEYDAYGNTIFSSAATPTPTRSASCAKYFDAESGWYYYGYRYYWPRIGQWTSRDRILERGGSLLYNFLFNRTPQTIDAIETVATRPPCHRQPKLYAIEGTAFTEFGSVREITDPSNVCYFCKDTVGDALYLPGVGTNPPFPNWGAITGSGTDYRVNQLIKSICADSCSECPPSQVNLLEPIPKPFESTEWRKPDAKSLETTW
ncbi:MAG: RHS repeat-associated core domain-containing protein [Phycisphaerae bacterium]